MSSQCYCTQTPHISPSPNSCLCIIIQPIVLADMIDFYGESFVRHYLNLIKQHKDHLTSEQYKMCVDMDCMYYILDNKLHFDDSLDRIAQYLAQQTEKLQNRQKHPTSTLNSTTLQQRTPFYSTTLPQPDSYALLPQAKHHKQPNTNTPIIPPLYVQKEEDNPFDDFEESFLAILQSPLMSHKDLHLPYIQSQIQQYVDGLLSLRDPNIDDFEISQNAQIHKEINEFGLYSSTFDNNSQLLSKNIQFSSNTQINVQNTDSIGDNCNQFLHLFDACQTQLDNQQSLPNITSHSHNININGLIENSSLIQNHNDIIQDDGILDPLNLSFGSTHNTINTTITLATSTTVKNPFLITSSQHTNVTTPPTNSHTTFHYSHNNPLYIHGTPLPSPFLYRLKMILMNNHSRTKCSCSKNNVIDTSFEHLSFQTPQIHKFTQVSQGSLQKTLTLTKSSRTNRRTTATPSFSHTHSLLCNHHITPISHSYSRKRQINCITPLICEQKAVMYDNPVTGLSKTHIDSSETQFDPTFSYATCDNYDKIGGFQHNTLLSYDNLTKINKNDNTSDNISPFDFFDIKYTFYYLAEHYVHVLQPIDLSSTQIDMSIAQIPTDICIELALARIHLLLSIHMLNEAKDEEYIKKFKENVIIPQCSKNSEKDDKNNMKNTQYLMNGVDVANINLNNDNDKIDSFETDSLINMCADQLSSLLSINTKQVETVLCLEKIYIQQLNHILCEKLLFSHFPHLTHYFDQCFYYLSLSLISSIPYDEVRHNKYIPHAICQPLDGYTQNNNENGSVFRTIPPKHEAIHPDPHSSFFCNVLYSAIYQYTHTILRYSTFTHHEIIFYLILTQCYHYLLSILDHIAFHFSSIFILRLIHTTTSTSGGNMDLNKLEKVQCEIEFLTNHYFQPSETPFNQHNSIYNKNSHTNNSSVTSMPNCHWFQTQETLLFKTRLFYNHFFKTITLQFTTNGRTKPRDNVNVIEYNLILEKLGQVLKHIRSPLQPDTKTTRGSLKPQQHPANYFLEQFDMNHYIYMNLYKTSNELLFDSNCWNVPVYVALNLPPIDFATIQPIFDHNNKRERSYSSLYKIKSKHSSDSNKMALSDIQHHYSTLVHSLNNYVNPKISSNPQNILNVPRNVYVNLQEQYQNNSISSLPTDSLQLTIPDNYGHLLPSCASEELIRDKFPHDMLPMEDFHENQQTIKDEIFDEEHTITNFSLNYLFSRNILPIYCSQQTPFAPSSQNNVKTFEKKLPSKPTTPPLQFEHQYDESGMENKGTIYFNLGSNQFGPSQLQNQQKPRYLLKLCSMIQSTMLPFFTSYSSAVKPTTRTDTQSTSTTDKDDPTFLQMHSLPTNHLNDNTNPINFNNIIFKPPSNISKQLILSTPQKQYNSAPNIPQINQYWVLYVIFHIATCDQCYIVHSTQTPKSPLFHTNYISKEEAQHVFIQLQQQSLLYLSKIHQVDPILYQQYIHSIIASNSQYLSSNKDTNNNTNNIHSNNVQIPTKHLSLKKQQSDIKNILIQRQHGFKHNEEVQLFGNVNQSIRFTQENCKKSLINHLSTHFQPFPQYLSAFLTFYRLFHHKTSNTVSQLLNGSPTGVINNKITIGNPMNHTNFFLLYHKLISALYLQHTQPKYNPKNINIDDNTNQSEKIIITPENIAEFKAINLDGTTLPNYISKLYHYLKWFVYNSPRNSPLLPRFPYHPPNQTQITVMQNIFGTFHNTLQMPLMLYLSGSKASSFLHWLYHQSNPSIGNNRNALQAHQIITMLNYYRDIPHNEQKEVLKSANNANNFILLNNMNDDSSSLSPPINGRKRKDTPCVQFSFYNSPIVDQSSCLFLYIPYITSCYTLFPISSSLFPVRPQIDQNKLNPNGDNDNNTNFMFDSISSYLPFQIKQSILPSDTQVYAYHYSTIDLHLSFISQTHSLLQFHHGIPLITSNTLFSIGIQRFHTVLNTFLSSLFSKLILSPHKDNITGVNARDLINDKHRSCAKLVVFCENLRQLLGLSISPLTLPISPSPAHRHSNNNSFIQYSPLAYIALWYPQYYQRQLFPTTHNYTIFPQFTPPIAILLSALHTSATTLSNTLSALTSSLLSSDDINELVLIHHPQLIDFYAYMNFPPCMLYMYQRLKTVRHLKHGSRYQLRVFLKDIGLSLNDAQTFWAKALPKMNQRELSYSIRHTYGREGRKQEYFTPSCVNMLDPITTDVHHGCYFQPFSRGVLTQNTSDKPPNTLYKSANTMIKANVNELIPIEEFLWQYSTHLQQYQQGIILPHVSRISDPNNNRTPFRADVSRTNSSPEISKIYHVRPLNQQQVTQIVDTVHHGDPIGACKLLLVSTHPRLESTLQKTSANRTAARGTVTKHITKKANRDNSKVGIDEQPVFEKKSNTRQSALFSLNNIRSPSDWFSTSRFFSDQDFTTVNLHDYDINTAENEDDE